MPAVKELELIRADENEQPALQKMEGVLNRLYLDWILPWGRLCRL